jgi:hypothetical protein
VTARKDLTLKRLARAPAQPARAEDSFSRAADEGGEQPLATPARTLWHLCARATPSMNRRPRSSRVASAAGSVASQVSRSAEALGCGRRESRSSARRLNGQLDEPGRREVGEVREPKPLVSQLKRLEGLRRRLLWGSRSRYSVRAELPAKRSCQVASNRRRRSTAEPDAV